MEEQFKSYRVWDLPTRIFHWVNVVCVLCMIAIGTTILNAGALGVHTEGKILLKTIHVYVGYVFAANLAIRLVWALFGNRFARFGSFLPIGKDYMKKLFAYGTAEKTGTPQQYLGHNPRGRLAVSVLFAALITMAITGLVLAGTDIYFPPFGSTFQEWVAASGVNPADVAPYVKDNLDPDAYKEMRAFRKPFIQTHVWTYYALMGLIVLHIGAVIYTEIKAGGGIISAMFSGKKVLPQAPEDEKDND